MGANTSIQWTDHTFNPWIGCTKVSVGPQGACEKCYAEKATPARAMRIRWGSGQARHRTSPTTWALPLQWERAAATFYAAHGRRQRVFCASLADVFDNEVDPQWRADLFDLVRATPRLVWLMLTKRIGNASDMLPADWGHGYQNVWLGATVATQDEAARDIPKLIETAARGRFLSLEPLLGEVDLTSINVRIPGGGQSLWNVLNPRYAPGVDWVIVGGESGPDARPCVVEHVRRVVRDCVSAGTAVFVKQLGAKPIDREGLRHPTHDRKGGDPDAWPFDLRVRQFPRVAA